MHFGCVWNFQTPCIYSTWRGLKYPYLGTKTTSLAGLRVRSLVFSLYSLSSSARRPPPRPRRRSRRAGNPFVFGMCFGQRPRTEGKDPKGSEVLRPFPSETFVRRPRGYGYDDYYCHYYYHCFITTTAITYYYYYWISFANHSRHSRLHLIFIRYRQASLCARRLFRQARSPWKTRNIAGNEYLFLRESGIAPCDISSAAKRSVERSRVRKEIRMNKMTWGSDSESGGTVRRSTLHLPRDTVRFHFPSFLLHIWSSREFHCDPTSWHVRSRDDISSRNRRDFYARSYIRSFPWSFLAGCF